MTRRYHPVTARQVIAAMLIAVLIVFVLIAVGTTFKVD